MTTTAAPAMPSQFEALFRDNPYVGLRPFLEGDALFFFGRSEQIDELTETLGNTRFLPIVGSSGSGKSSLVLAGLLPRLFGGFLVADRDAWRVATVRPGAGPLFNLASKLRKAFGESEDEASCRKFEQDLDERHSTALAEYIRDHLTERENLLIVVDQFEEIFAFRGTADDDSETTDVKRRQERARRREEAAAFVDLVLSISKNASLPVYVVLTMRTDFLGDCDVFYGLPEAMNESQYLVPRLNRKQLGQAITGPVRLKGTDVSPRLLDKLLNDLGERFDRLPVLQHALQRTFDEWKRSGGSKEIDIKHFDDAGGLENALEKDAEAAIKALEGKVPLRTIELVFKALTKTDERQRRVRQPTLLGDLVHLSGAPIEIVETLIREFQETHNRSFLYQRRAERKADIRVDISHESLIRQWKRLRDWVDEERDDKHQYFDLVTQAQRRKGTDQVLEGAELALVRKWWERVKPTKDWSDRYSGELEPGSFETAKEYFERSVATEQQKITDARKRKRRRRITIALVSIVVLVAVAWETLTLVAVVQLDEMGAKLTRVSLANDYAVRDPLTATQVALDLGQFDFSFDSIGARDPAVLQMLYRIGVQPIPAAQRRNVSVSALDPSGDLAAYGNDSGRVVIARADGFGPIISSKAVTAAAVKHVVFTRGDSILVWVSAKGEVGTWNHRTDEVVRLAKDTTPLARLDVTSDGLFVSAVDDNNVMTVWDTRTGKHLIQGTVRDAALSYTGHRLVFASAADGLVTWKLTDPNWQKLATVNTDDVVITLSKDGGTALVNDGGKLAVYASGKVRRIPAAGDVNNSIGLSSDGRLALVTDTSRVVRAYDAVTGTSLRQYLGHEAIALVVGFLPGDTLAYSIAADNEVHIWSPTDKSDAAARAVLRGHTVLAAELHTSQDGKVLQSWGYDSVAYTWRMPGTFALSERFDAHAAQPTGDSLQYFVVSGDGARAIVIPAHSRTGRYYALKPEMQSHPISRSCPEGDIYDRLLTWRRVCNGDDSRLLLERVGTTTSPTVLAEKGLFPATVSFSFDGRSTAVTWTDARNQKFSLRLYETATGKPEGPIIPLLSMPSAVSPLSRTGMMAVVEQDSMVMLDLTGRRPKLQLHGWNGGTRGAFTSTGDLFATYDAVEPQVWSVASGKLVTTLKGHEAEVMTLDWSHDGKRIATGTASLEIGLWNIDPSATTAKKAGQLKKMMHGHRHVITSVAWSPNDSLLVSSSADGRIRVWTTSDAAELVTLPIENAPAVAAFTPDGEHVIAASATGVIRRWSLNTAEVFQRLKQTTSACLPVETRTSKLGAEKADAEEAFAACEQQRMMPRR